MNVAIVGCGLIGRKRAEAMPYSARVIGCYDVSTRSSENLAKSLGCKVYRDFSELLNDAEIDLVVISTTHHSLANIATEIISRKKHVFIEKPGAINSLLLKRLVDLAKKNQVKVRIGFNHTFHPAVRKMFELVDGQTIGSLMFMRGRYGHGGRLGYEKEWRAKKEIAGGGELIDQGSHLIDISLRLFGNLTCEFAYTPTYFWEMQVEDNAFLALKDQEGRMAFLHASCTEWKNLFSLEVYGKKGKIEISGLGRSYGVETLTLYEMLPEMGPPVIQTWEFQGPDESWKLELDEFVSDIESETSFSDNTISSIRVLELIEEIYERSGR